MGLGGVSVWQLGIVLMIVIMIFGTRRIRQLGGDLGGMIRGIRDGMKDAEPVIDELQDMGAEVRDLDSKLKGTNYVRTAQERRG